MRVAIICPGQFGDIAESTPLFKYREELWGPSAEIHWFIGKRFADVLRHNPHVITHECEVTFGEKDIDKVVAKARQESFDKTYITAPYAHLTKVFRVPLPMIPPMVLGLKLRGRPWRPQIFLSEEEIAEAQEFVAALPKGPRVMIETTGLSFQSAWDDTFTERVAERLVDLKPVYLTASFGAADIMRGAGIKRVVGLDNIGFRQLTEIYNACDMFISCGSGAASATAAERCRILPRIEYLVRAKCPGWGTTAMVPGFAHWDAQIVLDKISAVAYSFLRKRGKQARRGARRWARRALRRGQPDQTLHAGVGG